MTSYEPHGTVSGLGCALVVPTAIFGIAMVADEHSSKLEALVEFFGWSTLCVLVALAISLLLRRHRTVDRIAAVTAAIAFFLLAVAEAHPDTPDAIKDIFVTLLRLFAIFGAVAAIFYAARALRASYRS